MTLMTVSHFVIWCWVLAVRTSCTDITDIVFGNNVNAVPAAFGDFNSDELTDLFVIKGNSVEVLLSSNEREPLLQSSNITCNFKCPVTSLVPGDFNGDAFMDVLVTTKCLGSENLNLTILWGHLKNINCTTQEIIKTRGEPLALDYNDDFITDLFGEDENGDRAFWVFNKDKTFEVIPFKKGCSRGTLPPHIRKPHSNAYLDLNNDCIADIFITSGKGDHNQVFEFWYGTGDEEKFKCETVLLPPNITGITKMGQSLFLDVELKGKMDHVLPLRTSSESKLFIYSSNTDMWHDLNVDLTDPAGVAWQWGWDDSVPLLTGITARGGDFNMDGYPDLLAPLMTSSGTFQTALLENVPCSNCRNFSRTFQVKWNAFYPHGNDTVTAAFYDIFQDGVMDVILVYRKGEKFTLGAFKNNLDYDANFVKVMVLSGLQNSELPFVETPLGKKRRTFGSNLPGPRIWYRTLDQEGYLRAGMSAQIPQSAHFALSLPYTTFALGRTPNFVDALSVGFASRSREWAQLIPNSQMVVIPSPIDNPSKWKVQLFVTPSKVILLSAAALLGTCLVIAIVIGVLHYKEKRSDRLERLQESFRFYH